MEERTDPCTAAPPFRPFRRSCRGARPRRLRLGGNANLAEIDNELLGNGADPALTSALRTNLSDPNLVQQAIRTPSARPKRRSRRNIRPAPIRASAARPPTESGGRAASSAPAGACGAALDYGPQWAGRLPAEFPPYPGGRVTEAAGANEGDCRVRVVTFTTPDPHNRVLEYYRSVAARAGFSAQHQVRGEDQLLGEVDEGSNGAFVLIVTPKSNGSEVALIVNNGR